MLVVLGVPTALAAPTQMPPPSGSKSLSFLADCTITGTAGDDMLVGTAAADVMCGLGGDDVIRGLGGSDTIYGGSGRDREFGGAGADMIAGQTGVDYLSGGPGDDQLVGGGEADTYVGGPGNDAIEDRIPKTQGGGWFAGVKPDYRLPKGTTVTWTYLANSGRCLDTVLAPVHQIVGSEDDSGSFQIFLTDSPNISDACYYETSRAWFGLEIDTPSGQHRVGQVEVETGAANALVHEATTTCLYWGSTHCEGGSATVAALLFTPYAPVVIGPVS